MLSKPISIYEINTVTWLRSLSEKQNRSVNLFTVPPEEWDRIASYGCDVVWLMGVWERSQAAIAIDKANDKLVMELSTLLPDFSMEFDLTGSGYSIRSYTVDDAFGGDLALTVARRELKQRGMKLLLDYVPNHVAPDHPWASEHPEYFVGGSMEDMQASPDAFLQVGPNVLARGKDPNFAPWPDVLQLNAFAPELRGAIKDLFASLMDKCDGVRCDMAMLMNNAIFSGTWQGRVGPPPETEFWTDIVSSVRSHRSDFLFIAEAYWNTEPELLNLGFDACYDKDFYDDLVSDYASKLREHLAAPQGTQMHQVRFLENHDEPRAAATLPGEKGRMAAVILATTPGSRLYYEGQFAGATIRTPVQLGRDPAYTPDEHLETFYKGLMQLMREIEPSPDTWTVCATSEDTVLAWTWRSHEDRYVTIVNFGLESREFKIDLGNDSGVTGDSHVTCQFATTPGVESAAHADENTLTGKLDGFKALILQVG